MKYILKCIVVITFFSFTPKIMAINNIKVDEYSLIPFFSDYITKYNVFINEEDDEVNITASLTEDDDYVTGTGNINVENGKNEVILKVMKKNSSIMTYTINIYKNFEANEEVNNASLKALNIEGYDIKFNPEVYEYTINIENEERLNINYEQSSELSIVKISGNSNLKIGENIIKISVNNKNGNNSNIYILKVNKVADVFEEELSSEKSNKNILGRDTLTKKETNIIIFVIITICSILIMFIFNLLFLRKKKH